MASKVWRINLRKVTRSKVFSTPGVIDIAADDQASAIKELAEWLPILCDQDVVTDVSDDYADISTYNNCENVEADIGAFELDKWAQKKGNKNATAATVAVA